MIKHSKRLKIELYKHTISTNTQTKVETNRLNKQTDKQQEKNKNQNTPFKLLILLWRENKN
jgi:hypothetical protein